MLKDILKWDVNVFPYFRNYNNFHIPRGIEILEIYNSDYVEIPNSKLYVFLGWHLCYTYFVGKHQCLCIWCIKHEWISLYVLMYVCMYACMYISGHAHTSHEFVCMYKCMYACMHSDILVSSRYVWMCICTCVYLLCMNPFMFVHVYPEMNRHMHAYLHVHM